MRQEHAFLNISEGRKALQKVSHEYDLNIDATTKTPTTITTQSTDPNRANCNSHSQWELSSCRARGHPKSDNRDGEDDRADAEKVLMVSLIKLVEEEVRTAVAERLGNGRRNIAEIDNNNVDGQSRTTLKRDRWADM